jgi:excisionase family DNA binding protein
MATDPEPWVSTETAAQYINKSPEWLSRNASRYGIPFRRLGRQLRFKISQIEGWLDQQLEA